MLVYILEVIIVYFKHIWGNVVKPPNKDTSE